jgi:hypothetical protein
MGVVRRSDVLLTLFFLVLLVVQGRLDVAALAPVPDHGSATDAGETTQPRLQGVVGGPARSGQRQPGSSIWMAKAR